MKLALEIPHETWHPRIVAFDPGGTTGWIKYNKGQFWGGQFSEYHHHLDIQRFLDAELYAANEAQQHLVIVTESFEYRQNTKNDEDFRKGLELISCEYIGVIRAWCLGNPIVSLVLQTAGEGKGFISDRKIQRLGLTEAHGAITNPDVKHMWDAFRHIVHQMTVRFRIREGLIDKMKRPREDDEE